MLLEPFSVAPRPPAEHLPSSELNAGPWVRFALRREAIYSKTRVLPSMPPSPVIREDSDSEAEAVRTCALQSIDSEDEPSLGPNGPQLFFVCNGPWSCCHVPTDESVQAYEIAHVAAQAQTWLQNGHRSASNMGQKRYQPLSPQTLTAFRQRLGALES